MKIVGLAFLVLLSFSDTTAQTFCPPLQPPSKGRGMEIQCQYGGQDTNCFNGYLFPGTVAEYRCKPYHVPIRGNNNNNHAMTCNNNGQWAGQYHYDTFICNLDCGKPAVNFQKLIAGSEPTRPLYWPWHATIFHYNGINKIEYKCGGSLVSLNIVMTAAHCVTTGKPIAILVILAAGNSNFHLSMREPTVQMFQVKKIIPKENFNPSTLQSDIALLVLDRDVVLTDSVSPVCLPEDPDSNLNLSPGTLGEAVGFGYFDRTNTRSPILRYAQLELQSPRSCVKALDYIPLSSQFCAGSRTGQAACMGDSGGGLYFKYGPIGKERYSVEGIVSFGDRSSHLRGTCENFGVFTRVLYFRQWIDEMLDTQGEDISVPKSTPKPSSSVPSLYPVTTARTTTVRPTTTKTSRTTATTTSTTVYSPSTSPPPQQPPSPPVDISVTGAAGLQLQALNLHNWYRSQHGAPPLKLSAQLNYDAQEWADYLITSRRRLALIRGRNYGQNIFEFTITGATLAPEEVMQKAMESWYASKSKYNPLTPHHSSWTQLVWKASTELGVGLATQNGRTVVICFYLPMGNIKTVSGSGKYYVENVQL